MTQIRRSDGQIVLPMFSTDERVGLTTVTGSMIYNLDTNKINVINLFMEFDNEDGAVNDNFVEIGKYVVT